MESCISLLFFLFFFHVRIILAIILHESARTNVVYGSLSRDKCSTKSLVTRTRKNFEIHESIKGLMMIAILRAARPSNSIEYFYTHARLAVSILAV